MSLVGSLNVYYRGNRNYIQGSLVMAQARSLIIQDDPSSFRDYGLSKANFTSLINHHLLVFESAAPEGSVVQGTLVLEGRDKSRRDLILVRDPHNLERPERLPDTPSLVRFTQSDDTGAEGETEDLQNFDQFIMALIEMNKKWHAKRDKRAKDIWFLSLYDVLLPLDPNVYAGKSRIVLRHMKKAYIRGRCLTTNALDIQFEKGPHFNLKLLFSFLGQLS